MNPGRTLVLWSIMLNMRFCGLLILGNGGSTKLAKLKVYAGPLGVFNMLMSFVKCTFPKLIRP